MEAFLTNLALLVLLVIIGFQVYWVFPHLTTPCYLFEDYDALEILAKYVRNVGTAPAPGDGPRDPVSSCAISKLTILYKDGYVGVTTSSVAAMAAA
jgi:hypothetical protein